MKRSTRILLLTAATLLPFLLLALLVPPLLKLTGSAAWLARGVFLLIGSAAALVVFFHLRARAKLSPEPVTEDDEIDSAIRQAKQRLKASNRGSLRKLPLLLVVGPVGSTKTTVITRSGLEPELLAGEIYRGDTVVPTRGVNIWFAEDTVVVEAGAKVASEPARFARLLGHLQPSRLAAILPGGKQAPRMALVCFGCDEFLKPGASELATAGAQKLRTQLVDAAARLGMRLPVYVLFTRADRLPYFADFVRSFTREEAGEVLGTTLPLRVTTEPGGYAEREAVRIGGAFEGIFRNLSLRRLDTLPRETAEEVRAGVYEFPREIRKFSSQATQFLVDLCRPTQLGMSPFLRGFYFTGVRAVIHADTWVAPTAPTHSLREVDATSVFNPAQLMAQQQAAAPSSGGRKVPEWAFLQRVIGQLLLRDRVAQAATAGGTRVNFLRRALVGVPAGALILLCIALFVSWRANGRVVNAALGAARGVEAVDLAGGGVPTLEDLQHLDSLRAQLLRLRGWAMDGAPRSHRWGLFIGDDVLATLRPLYFQRLERMLWSQARGNLLGALQTLPEQPNQASEYGATYDALKAYLITTSHPHYSTADFLSPELMKHWRAGREVDPERSELVDQQFAFFATELPHGNPYGNEPDDPLVARTRNFLGRFSNIDQFYQALIAEASRRAQPVRFIGTDPVSDAVVVQGAYTEPGWTFVQTNLQNVDQLFARESWVLGDAAVPEGDRARIASELRQRYVNDYIQQWQNYLAAGRVSAFNGPQDASAKLRVLSSQQSPLLSLLALASRNTAVDSLTVARAFQPVHTVMPHQSATDRLIVDANQPYMQGLLALQGAMDQVATAQGAARQDAMNSARSAADQVKMQIQQTAQTFEPGVAQPVGTAVEQLLLAPIRSVERLLTALPAAGLNTKGQSFCSAFRPLAGKYPFNRQSQTAAEAAEVAAMFKPGSSALWQFYEENLTELLVRQGDGYGRSVSAERQPTRDFEAFFSRAAEVSRALFAEDGSGPQVVFELRPVPTAQVPQIRVEIDGRTHTVTPTERASRTFHWQAANGRSARITATINGAEVTVAEAQGAWAVFRLFHQSDPNWERVTDGRYRLRWPVPTQNASVEAEVTFDKRIPIFKPDYFDRLQCVSTIVAR